LKNSESAVVIILTGKELLNSTIGDLIKKATQTQVDTEKFVSDFTVNPKETDLVLEVTDVLSGLGVPRNVKGFNYLREAIILSVDDESYIQNITRQLYPEIAMKFETTPTRAERAIRHAIEVTFGSRGNRERMNAMFGYSVNPAKGKVTNSEFIATIADKLRLRRRSV
jgi:two-component system response regulator (stage 0 sporulation protein A)